MIILIDHYQFDYILLSYVIDFFDLFDGIYNYSVFNDCAYNYFFDGLDYDYGLICYDDDYVFNDCVYN